MAIAVQQAAPVMEVEGYKALGHLAHGDGPLTKYSIPTSSIHIHILSSVIGQTILYLSLNTISGACSHFSLATQIMLFMTSLWRVFRSMCTLYYLFVNFWHLSASVMQLGCSAEIKHLLL